ncbi:MAG: DUF5518 domain-containing protein [Methanosphaera sp.]|nr:DUF5518 domain-containing protein [Methanosphaera sp.]
MNINEIIKVKSILIAIIIIVIFSLLSTDSSTIIPFFLFVGILMGIILGNDKRIALINSFIASLIGSFISFAISTVIVYYTESPLYAIAVIQSAKFLLIFYVVITVIGAAIGYYIRDEIKNKG